MGIRLGVQNVLPVDGHPGAGLIVPVDDLGDLVLIAGARQKAGACGLKRGLQVDARLGGKGVALRVGGQNGAADQVVHQLGDAAAGSAAGINGLSHTRQNRFDLVKSLLVAAHHDSQCAGNGHGIAAAHRGVQQGHPRVPGLLVQLLDDMGRGRAQVHDHISRPAVPDGLLYRAADDGVGGQDLQDHVAPAVQLLRTGGRNAACGPEGVHLPFGHVIAHDRQTALLDHVFRHGQSHDAHTDKSDHFHRVSLPPWFSGGTAAECHFSILPRQSFARNHFFAGTALAAPAFFLITAQAGR